MIAAAARRHRRLPSEQAVPAVVLLAGGDAADGDLETVSDADRVAFTGELTYLA